MKKLIALILCCGSALAQALTCPDATTCTENGQLILNAQYYFTRPGLVGTLNPNGSTTWTAAPPFQDTAEFDTQVDGAQLTITVSGSALRSSSKYHLEWKVTHITGAAVDSTISCDLSVQEVPVAFASDPQYEIDTLSCPSVQLGHYTLTVNGYIHAAGTSPFQNSGQYGVFINSPFAPPPPCTDECMDTLRQAHGL